MTIKELTTKIRAAGYEVEAADIALQDAYHDGISQKDARAAVKAVGKLNPFAVVKDAFEAAADGGHMRAVRADTAERHQRYLDQKREKDVAALRDKMDDAPSTTLRRITADDASLHGSEYLGHEGEWAEMPK